MKITIIAGARPNFVKVAAILLEITKQQKEGREIDYQLVHTGQHFDDQMSGRFFRELGIPQPDLNLAAGGGTQAEQTAQIMVAFEKCLQDNPTDLVLVVGDVTSTMACTIVAKKMGVAVAHVEAGIRSFDLSMPEEINRMVTDSISDYFFTTSRSAGENLNSAGISNERIFFVGNVMIDTLMTNMSRFTVPDIWQTLKLEKGNYLVMTLHRPSNVDQEGEFEILLKRILTHSRGMKIIFPVHPRTRQILNQMDADTILEQAGLYMVAPMAYLEFNYLVQHAKAVLTDSGGITEEATLMNVPCLTLRENTERPETCEIGTNVLLGTSAEKIQNALDVLFDGSWKKGGIPEKWDGKSASRIVDSLMQIYG